jgi:spermidine/putrescine transport system substrate-binding protein
VSKIAGIEVLIHQLERGTIDRREFIYRGAALGLSLTTIGPILNACRGREGPEDGGNAALAGELGEIGDQLNIYNWSDYIAEDTVPKFEEEFGVRVTYDTYESNEEMVSKLQAGASGYDLVVPTGYIVEALIAIDLLAPVSNQYLTNWGNLAPIFLNPPFDPGNAHTVPYQWGTLGIAYRSDEVEPPPDSWGIFHDTSYRGKMTLVDDMRDVIGAFLKYRGHSNSSTVPAQLEQAKRDAIAAVENIKAFISAPVKGQLITGDVWIAQLWNGDTAQAKVEQPAIAYAIPEEGATIWTDSMVIPKSAPHKRAAHEFMNFVLRPDIGAEISNFSGYGSPNSKAVLDNPVPYPSAEELARLEYQKDLGAQSEVWDRIWTEIKSA